MVFEIKDKVALVTGGVSGLGLEFVKELLQKGAKGVTIADINEEKGRTVLEELIEVFGKDKIIFVKANVANIEEFEDAFKETLEKFGSIDILINNAGTVNEKFWQKVIPVNLNGVVHGMILGLDNYLMNHKQGSEAVIVNISSIAGLKPYPWIPIYSATKAAVIGMTRCWGLPYHYERTKVKVIALCPGSTTTDIFNGIADKTLGKAYNDGLNTYLAESHFQDAKHVAIELMEVIQVGENGSIWVVTDGKPAYEYSFSSVIN